MKKINTAILFAVLISLLVLSGCSSQPEKPKWSWSVAELLASPIYESDIQIFGQVSALGELLCSCFILTSDEQTLEVWYDTMINDDHSLKSPVYVGEIENGDWVVVTGELKPAGGHHYSLNDFWASKIVVVP